MRSTRVLSIAVALMAWLVAASIGAPHAAAIPSSLLYDQTQTQGNAIISADSPDDQYDSEAADDFVVPSATTWTLSSLVVAAHNGTGVDVTSFRVRIYSNNGGVPGTVLFDQTDAGTGDGYPANETITLNPAIALNAGTYWLSVQGLATNYQWFWDTGSGAFGSPAQWRNPPNGLATGCTNFGTLNGTCFSSEDLTSLIFQVFGTSAASSGGAGLCNGLTPTVSGSGTISGTPGPDVIMGSDGADDISGGGGADTICAGDGDDVVHGGGGGDRIDGGAGKDQVFGQAGDDVISGGGDNDSLKGQDGHDQISGGQGNDTLAGGTGDDFLSGGDGKDHLFGGDGGDTANGSAGNDVMFGGPGNDDLHGNAGEDSLDGGIGTDSCKGGGGTDTLTACEN